MPNYKLTYFDMRGVAEPMRLIFAYANVDFEDVRITGPHTPLRKDIKDKIDGKALAQSAAITRYLAKIFNLIGADDFEAAKCDEYVDTIRDFGKEFYPIYREKDQVKRAEMLKPVVDDISKKYLTKFNDIVAANGGKLVGKNLTWADIYLAHTLNDIEPIFNVNILAGFPALKSLTESVFSVPQIKRWVEKRPLTDV